jgi:hypothetical protein
MVDDLSVQIEELAVRQASDEVVLKKVDGIVSNLGGWIPCESLWEYASADAPTFTFTVYGDWTDTIYPGTKLKLTQTTTKYFIVTASSYSSPNTTITVYGGTDYTLTSDPITAEYFSYEKAPVGFPLSPDKWSVIVADTTDRTQASPTSGTWYNLGSLSIAIPLGLWIVSYEVNLRVSRSSAGIVNQFVTLSNANNTELSSTWSGQIYTSSSTDFRGVVTQIPMVLSLAAKATYYLNSKTTTASMTGINFYGATSRATIIKAVCAYL